ncbi:MAG: phosphoribosyltransferase family protein [Aquabacterium sp.]|uniref:phosphoribosyltransferase family protein n=1 Tax=Aquabacterium sp. TaxID=1872578 RepID=UPI003BAFD625
MSQAPSLPGDVGELVEAIRLVVRDFDGRPTHVVQGMGGQRFEFFPTAITDNIPPLSHALSEAVCLLSRLHIDPALQPTLGVGEEDRGAMITADILRQYHLPRTLARWTPSGAPGEVAVPLANEYLAEGSTQVYLNGVRPDDRVLVVDDLISTGGTLAALVRAVRQAGAQVVEIFTIGEKLENTGRQRLMAAAGVTVKTLLASDMQPTPEGLRSRVRRVHLGKLDSAVFQRVCAHFPAGFCHLGHGDHDEHALPET